MTVPYQCLSTVVRTLSKVLSSVRAPGPGEEHGFEVNQPRFRFGTGEELRRDILFIHYFLPTSLCISIYSLFPTFFPIHNFFLVNFPILFYVYNLTGILSYTFLIYHLTGKLSNTFLHIPSTTYIFSYSFKHIPSYWYTFLYTTSNLYTFLCFPTHTTLLVYFPILS